MSVALQQFPPQFAPTLLKKDGVAIGPLLPEDVATLFVWMNDIEAARQDLGYRPMDGNAFASWLAGFASDTSRVLFIIRVAGKQAAAGYVMLTGIQSVHRSAELGIRIGAECDRGRGIGSTAVGLTLDYAWNHLNLVRVQLRVMADNTRAVRAYSAAGFVAEGRHSMAAYVNGRWHDMVTMAALRPADGSRGDRPTK